MDTIGERNPIQFFRYHWSDVEPLFDTNDRVQKQIADILQIYVEMIGGPIQIENFHDLDLVEYEARLKDFHANYKDRFWLSRWVHGYDLAVLSRIIGEELFPLKKWIYIEYEDQFAVVDDERTLVLDLKHFDKLSGLGTMANVGDPLGLNDPQACAEANKRSEDENAMYSAACDKVREHLQAHDRENGILRFPPR